MEQKFGINSMNLQVLRDFRHHYVNNDFSYHLDAKKKD
jgi:hypothetical protein